MLDTTISTLTLKLARLDQNSTLMGNFLGTPGIGSDINAAKRRQCQIWRLSDTAWLFCVRVLLWKSVCEQCNKYHWGQKGLLNNKLIEMEKKATI